MPSVWMTWYGYFYPRPPRGGRLKGFGFRLETLGFLSTPSARRATHQVDHVRHIGVISIHALREEGDRGASAPCAG